MLYVFKPFWSLLTKGGEAYEVDSLQAGTYGVVALFLLSSYNSHSETFGFSVVTLKPDGRLLLLLPLCDAMINSA